jgi:hypothetical protein
MEEIGNAYILLGRKPNEKKLFGKLDIDGRIILKWILKKQGGSSWTDFIWPIIGTSGGLL